MTQLFDRNGKARTQKSTDEKGRPVDLERKNCGRCGGAGGSDRWAFTGWTCYDCGGKGWQGDYIRVRLYTAEENAKLDATQAKREAKRAEKARLAMVAEAERIRAEAAACVARNADLLRRCAPFEHKSAFVADMVARIMDKALDLTPAQLDAVQSALGKLEAEEKRRATATYIGEVGERREFELEFVRCLDLGDRFDPFYIVVFRAPCGSSVVYKGGSPHSFRIPEEKVGDEWRYVKGGKVRVVATVKAHTTNQKTGEPETIIFRPKVAKAAKAA